MDEYVEENRRHWEDAASHHPDTDHYDVEGFLDGETTLSRLERRELGGEVGQGTDLLHLQCHFGLDTLSWAREGADVVGVDFSAVAVETARDLAAEADLADRAEFVESSVYDLPDALDGGFDVVFTSYGVLGWLPDLDRWAEVAARFVRPGGTFYLAEHHPLTETLRWDFDGGKTEFVRPYFTPDEPMTYEGPGTYADYDLELEHDRSHTWPHGLGEMLTALLDAGLSLEFVHEHSFAVEEQFEGMTQDDDGFWRFESGVEIPLTVSIRATKPA
jgi:SAM-dependent methyltransferase